MSLAFVLISLLAPWRLWAAVLYRPFSRTVPRIAFKFALALTAYTLFVCAIALHVPIFLAPLAIAALGVVGWDLWCARPSYGRSRGLPPGSLSRFSLRALFDKDHHRKAALRYGPVFKNCFFMNPTICIVGMARSQEFLRNAGAKIRPPRYPFSRFIPGGFLRSLEPAKHSCYRKIFQDIFSSAVVRDCAPEIAGIIRAQLARAADESARDPRAGVQMRPHLYRVVFDAWLRLFLGVAPEAPESARLRHLYHVIDIRNRGFDSDRSVAAAADELIDFVRQQMQRFRDRKSRGEEIPRCFLSQLIEVHAEESGDPTVLGNLAFLLHSSWGDISGFSQWVIKLLTDNPEWVDRIRAELEAGMTEKSDDGKDLIARAIHETFRTEQSELLLRLATEDVVVDGFTIPRGWLIRICVWESHRDAAVFKDPDTFNPDRFLGREYTRNEFSPFGALQHACLGPATTMMFGRALITELVSGYDWHAVSDGPHEYGAWCHWRPSSRFRIALASRTR